MKKIKVATIIFTIAFIYFFIYNTYYGWNMKPESLMELKHDNLLRLIIRVGIIIYFLPLLDIYESFIKKNESKS